MVGFEINLKKFALGDVIQFLAHVKKSGVLKVKGGVGGEIYLKEGLVVHATDGNEKGMDALLNLSFVDLETGSFEPDVAPAEETISEDLGKLTETIEKRRIEFQEIKKKLPPMETIFAKSTKDLESAVALRRTDWQILALIDGRRTLSEVMTESKIGGYEGTKTIIWLKEQGLIYDPREAERVMAKLTNFLEVFFADFSKNGLNWLYAWVDLDAKNKNVKDALDINEETFEITPIAELSAQDIEEALESIKAYIKSEGPKMYGKVLFKKKLQGFLKKVEN
jgi:hypothetical protein